MKVGVSYWYNKGVALCDVDMHEKALYCFDKALSMEKDDDLIWFRQGIALFHAKRLQEAVSSFDHSLGINPDNVVALNNMGVALSILKKFEESDACLKKALDLKKGNPGIQINIKFLNEMKQTEKFRTGEEV